MFKKKLKIYIFLLLDAGAAFACRTAWIRARMEIIIVQAVERTLEPTVDSAFSLLLLLNTKSFYICIQNFIILAI